MKALIISTIALSFLAGCKDSNRAQFFSQGQHHIIKQFSGGQLVGQWESTGSVSNEEKSDGFYFEDAATRNLVEVAGTIQITIK